jgi:hypothetical protein
MNKCVQECLPSRKLFLNSTFGGNNFSNSYEIPQILFMQEKNYFHLPFMKVIAIQFFNILNINSGRHDFECNNAKKQTPKVLKLSTKC